jgi:hypothetical protein
MFFNESVFPELLSVNGVSLNFYEKSQRYSKLIDYRWCGVNGTGNKWEDRKLFSCFVEMLLGCYLHWYNIFSIMFTMRCRQADFVASVSSPLSLTPTINYRQCYCYWRLMIVGVIVTSDKLIACVMESMKIWNRLNHRCQRKSRVSVVVSRCVTIPWWYCIWDR